MSTLINFQQIGNGSSIHNQHPYIAFPDWILTKIFQFKMFFQLLQERKSKFTTNSASNDNTKRIYQLTEFIKQVTSK